jgi:hypothetical protein
LAVTAKIGLALTCAAVAGWTWATDLEGAYHIDAAASDDIPKAIERGTEEMSFAIRPLARSLTAKTNPCYQRIAILRDDGSVSLHLDSRPPIRVPLNGQSVRWIREDGGIYHITADWGSSLVMHFHGNDGDRTNTFAPGADGRTLTLHVELSSSRLPGPIEYSLVYRRD